MTRHVGRVRLSTPADIDALLDQGLREADLRELYAAETDPGEALVMGLGLSLPAPYTILVDEVPAAMFGAAVHHENSDIGCPWLLGTERLLLIQRQFLRESRYWRDLIAQPFGLLLNAVHEDNKVHIKWLRWLGFQFHEQSGVFIPFSWRRECVL